ncbi:hypothetical protein V8C26DRAFT_385676, partial [Trichoderma gracile]
MSVSYCTVAVVTGKFKVVKIRGPLGTGSSPSPVLSTGRLGPRCGLAGARYYLHTYSREQESVLGKWASTGHSRADNLGPRYGTVGSINRRSLLVFASSLEKERGDVQVGSPGGLVRARVTFACLACNLQLQAPKHKRPLTHTHTVTASQPLLTHSSHSSAITFSHFQSLLITVPCFSSPAGYVQCNFSHNHWQSRRRSTSFDRL